MANNYRIDIKQVRDQADIVRSHVVDGQLGTVRLQAGPHQQYVLRKQMAENLGLPDQVKVKRVGKNLHISFDLSVEADVVIEGYFDPAFADTQTLSAQLPDGQLTDYVLADPVGSSRVLLLAEGLDAVEMVPSGLGGYSAMVGNLLSFDLFPMLLSGAGVVSAASVAGGAAGGETDAKDPPDDGQAADLQQAILAVQNASAAVLDAQKLLLQARAALGDPPPPAQLAQVEQLQSALMTATVQAEQAATNALAAAKASHEVALANSQPDPAGVGLATDEAVSATELALAANELIRQSEERTDAWVADAGQAAQTAATAASAAAALTQSAQATLDQRVVALQNAGSSATPGQIKAVEDQQAVVAAAAQKAALAASAAKAAALAAQDAARAANESDPTTAVTSAVASAMAAASAADAAVEQSEALTDAWVASLDAAAQTAATAASAAAALAHSAQATLDQLVATLQSAGSSATPGQIKAVADQQAVVAAAAQQAALASSAAKAAALAAHQVAAASGEPDPAGVVVADAAATVAAASDTAGVAAIAAASSVIAAATAANNSSESGGGGGGGGGNESQSQIQALNLIAQSAATAANAAAMLLSDAMDILQTLQADLENATPARILAIEAQQLVVHQLAQTALPQAAIAMAAADAAHTAAVAAGQNDPAGVSAANDAADAVLSKVSAANALVQSSEEASDARVQAAGETAQTAADAAHEAALQAQTAKAQLDAAVTALDSAGTSATAQQIQQVKDKQAAATAAAQQASTKATAAQAAAQAAHNLAQAAGEPDPAGVAAASNAAREAGNAAQAASAAGAGTQEQALINALNAQAQTAATAATQAAQQANSAKAELNTLKAQIESAGTAATPEQITALQAQQVVVTAAAQTASQQAQAATEAATAAHTAAVATGQAQDNGTGDPAGVAQAAAAAAAATQAASEASQVVSDSEDLTDALVQNLGDLAATAASQAQSAATQLGNAQTALDNFKATVQTAGAAVTPAQVQAAEDQQAVVSALAQSAQSKAQAATAAAQAAHAAAQAASEADPPGVQSATDAADAAQAAVSAANAAVTHSEAATDARVLAAGQVAQTAADAARAAASDAVDAKADLDAAVNALDSAGTSATAQQILLVKDKQAAATDAAQEASTKATAAQAAAQAAHNLAQAAGEPDPAGVAEASNAASEAVNAAQAASSAGTGAGAQAQALISALNAQAQKAASAATQAAQQANSAKAQLNTLKSQIESAGTAATPEQITALQAQQVVVTAAAQTASQQAQAATEAATAAHTAAVATGQAQDNGTGDPAGVAQAAAAAAAATQAASEASQAVSDSEDLTDALVQNLGDLAATAASEAQSAIDAMGSAQLTLQTLMDALDAAGQGATAQQLSDVQEQQALLQALALASMAQAQAVSETAQAAHSVALAAGASAVDLSAAQALSAQTVTAGQASALSLVASAAQLNNASDVTTPLAIYQLAGLAGAGSLHVTGLEALHSALNSAAVGGAQVDTPAHLQAVFVAYQAILNEANGNLSDSDPQVNPGLADYASIGVTGVSTGAQSLLLTDVIRQRSLTEVNRVSSVQVLADAVVSVQAYTGSGAAPSRSALEALVTGLSEDNYPLVLKALAQSNAVAPFSSQSALQNLVTATQNRYQSALTAIAQAADGNTANTTLSETIFADAGVLRVDGSNVEAIRSALNTQAVLASHVATTADIQALVDTFAVILAEADGQPGNNPLAPDPQAADYAAVGADIGAAAHDADNLALLNDILGEKTPQDLQQVTRINDLAGLANAIQALAAGGAGLSLADWTQAGVTLSNGLSNGQWLAFEAVVRAQSDDGSATASVQALRTLLNQVNTRTLAISNAADSNTAVSSLTAQDFEQAGIQAVDALNIDLLRQMLDTPTVGSAGLQTPLQIQQLVDAVNALQALTDGVNNNGAPLTADRLQILGLAGVVDSTDKQTLFNDILDNAALADVGTAANVLNLASIASRLVQVTQLAQGQSVQPALAATDFDALHLSGVNAQNLADVLAFIATPAQAASATASLAGLQHSIDTFHWQASAAVPTLAEALNGVSMAELANGLQLSVALPVTAQAGDTLTLTFSPQVGAPYIITHVIGVLERADGLVSMNVTAQAAQLTGDYTLSTVITRASDGEPSQTSTLNFSVDVDAPVLQVTRVAGDAVSANAPAGVFTALELAASQAGNAPLTVEGTTDAEVNQVVAVTLNGKTYTSQVQAGPNGQDNTWRVEVDSTDAQDLRHDQSYGVYVSITDRAGNSSHDQSRSLRVDIAEPDVPTVHGLKTNTATPLVLSGLAQKLDAQTQMPIALEAGDVIHIELDGQTCELTIGASVNGLTYDALTKTWTLDTALAGFTALAAGVYNVVITITSGQVPVTDVSTDELDINDAAPELTLHPVTGDDQIDAFDSTQTMILSGTTNAAPGSQVTLQVADQTFTTEVFVDEIGQRLFWVDTGTTPAALMAGQNGDLVIEAHVVNEYGNDRQLSRDVPVDVQAPGQNADGTDAALSQPLLVIAETAQGLNADELANGVAITVGLPTGTVVSDSVTITVLNSQGVLTFNTYPLTSEDVGAGQVSITLPVGEFGYDDHYSIVAVTRDVAGNVSHESLPVSFVLDTLAPGQQFNLSTDQAEDGTVPLPMLDFAEGAQGIDAAELADGIQLMLTLPTGSAGGDTLQISFTDPDAVVRQFTHTLSPQEASQGQFTLTVPASKVLKDGHYSVSVISTDAVGNPGQAGQSTFELVAALSTLRAAAQDNSATASSPALSVYQNAGVVGVNASNQALIHDAINLATVGAAQFGSLAQIEAMASAATAILSEANGGLPDTSPLDPTAAQYALLGITGVSAGVHEVMLGDLLGTLQTSDVGSVAQIQALADAVAVALAATTVQTAPGLAQWALLMPGVTQDQLAMVNAAWVAAHAGNTPVTTYAGLQSVVNAAQSSYQQNLGLIQAGADQNNATGDSVPDAAFSALGVNFTQADALASVRDALNSTQVAGSHLQTVVQVQQLVSAYEKVLQRANGALPDDGALDPQAADYAALGISDIDTADEIRFLGDVLGHKTRAGVDQVAEVRALAQAVLAVQAYSGSGTAPTLEQLNLLVSGVTAQNLSAVLAAIAADNADGTPVSSVANLQQATFSGQIQLLGADAQTAANDANAAVTALITQQTTLNTLKTTVVNAGANATPAQIKAVEDQQAVVTAALQAAQAKATEATQAAQTAASAAQAANETAPAGVAQATQAASNVQTAVDAAQAALSASEAATDARVAALGVLAQTAATQANTAASDLVAARQTLDAALNVMDQAGAAVTPAQVKAVEDQQAVVSAAKQTAQTKADAATTAAQAAQAAAAAASETDPASVVLAQKAAADATLAVQSASQAVQASEAQTDLLVAEFGQSAQAAATAATQAATQADSAKATLNSLKAVVDAAGTAATPAQIKAQEDQQAVVTLAAQAAQTQATAATQAAHAAHNVAVAAGEADPAGVALAQTAASTASTAGSQASAVATAAESATDTLVATLGTAAQTAATQANQAINHVQLAKNALASAVSSLSHPATESQITDVENRQSLLASAARDAVAKAASATTAAQKAHLAAVAAGESDPTGVAQAQTAASAALVAASFETAPVLLSVDQPLLPVMELTDASAQNIAAFSRSLTVTGLDLDASNGTSTITASAGQAQATWLSDSTGNYLNIQALLSPSALSFSGTAQSDGLRKTLSWTYDPAAVNLDWLSDRDVLTVTFPVTVSNGTTVSAAQDLVITIEGKNDSAVIGGAVTASITQSAVVQSVGGQMTITDVDNPAQFLPQTNALGNQGYGYGTFSLSASGAWTYTMDGPHKELVAGMVYTDSLTAISVDGTRQTIVVTLNGTNDAPVLADTFLRLPTTLQGQVPLNGQAVGTLVSNLGAGITDVDVGVTRGIAITGFNSGGKLWISLNGGSTWTEQTGVSSSSAIGLLADADNRIYFQPGIAQSGELLDAVTFRAWDRTDNQPDGGRLNVTATGGSTPFSTAQDTVSQTVVKAVTVDNISTDNIVNPSEPLVITGTADNNATVAVTLGGQTTQVLADGSGNWRYDGTTVRYIMVRKDLKTTAYGTGTGDVQVNAMWSIGDVRAISGGSNVALSKTVLYSANGTRSANGSLVDGLESTFVEIAGSTVSPSGSDVWMQVDLGAPYNLSSIDVLARSGGWAERLNGSVVYTSNQDMSTLSRGQLDSAFHVGRAEVALNNDGTVFTVPSPVSGNALDLAVGGNTLTATEVVQGVTSTATRTVVTTSTSTSSWRWDTAFDGTDPLGGAVWDAVTTGIQYGTTATNIVNANGDADNELKLFHMGIIDEQTRLRKSDIALGQDQRLTSFHVEHDMDFASNPATFLFSLSKTTANRLLRLQFTTPTATSDTVVSLFWNVGTAVTVASATITGGLAARQADHVTFDITEAGLATLTLHNSTDADLVLSGTIPSWATANMEAISPEFYAAAGQNNAASGWLDNLQLSAAVTSSVVLPVVSGISLSDNAGAVTGTFTTAATDDTTPTLTGTTSAGATVRLYEGAILLGTTTAHVTTGVWDLEIPLAKALTDGLHTLSARAVDARGNMGESTLVNVLVNATTNTLTYSNDFDGADPLAGSGWASGGSGTMANSIVNANADADKELKILNPGVLPFLRMGDSIALGNNQGMLNFNVQFDADVTGMVAASALNRVELRYTGPGFGSGGAGVPGLIVAFRENALSVTWNNLPVTPVSATPFASLSARSTDQVSVNMANDGTLTITLTGGGPTLSWSASIPEWPASSGTPGRFFIYGDSAGNGSSGWIDHMVITATSKSLVLLPSVSITSVHDNVSPNPLDLSPGAVTADTLPSLTGMATPGSLVRVFDGEIYLGSAYAHMTTGVWTFAMDGTGVKTAAGFVANPLASGVHNLQARAVDSQGNMGDIASFSLTVDAAAPSVTSVSITGTSGTVLNNTLNAGDGITVGLNLSEPVDVSNPSAIRLKLNVGSTLVDATYDTTNSTSTLLKFKYTILAGQTDDNGISVPANALVLNTGVVQDPSGNNLNLTTVGLADNASYMVDTTAPTTGTLALAVDNGTSTSDGITGNGQINLNGLELGASWEYSSNAGNSWSAGTGSNFILPAGVYAANAVQMRQTDQAGNVQTVISAKNPNAITVYAPVTINAVSADGFMDRTEALILSGTAQPNTTVSLTVNSRVIRVTSDAQGDWDYQGTKVRYIMVRKTLSNDTSANGYLSIGDIVATNAATGINMALTATQTVSNREAFYSPSGSYADGSIRDGSVLNTTTATYAEAYGIRTDALTADGDAWVQLDLGAAYSLYSIVARSVAGNTLYSNRLNGAVIYASATDMSTMSRAQLDASPEVNASLISGLAANTASQSFTNTAPSMFGIDMQLTGTGTITAQETLPGFTNTASTGVTVSQAGATFISLGGGRLIRGVQVEGKWYYYWDLSNDNTSGNYGIANGGVDYVTHNYLDNLFKYDINGVPNTTVPNADGLYGTTDVYRYATISGVRVALPTANGGLPFPQGLGTLQNGTPATTNGTSSFDELLAIWDTYNGIGTNTGTSGVPVDWAFTSYWTATPSSSGHVTVRLSDGLVFNASDGMTTQVILQVLPVVVDLNRDGRLGYGHVTMDVNGDGLLDRTAWAGAKDGVLVWDKYADGLLHDHSQYAFAQYASTGRLGQSATDLQGLATAFDSNHDGVLDAHDAQFSEFMVWQDVNQNGVSDPGEMRTLTEWGITSVSVVSDGVQRTPAPGVTEAGRTTAEAVRGTSILVSDAAFEFQPMAYRVDAAADAACRIDVTGQDMQLDLARFVAQHGTVAEIGLEGTGANTLKIDLADLLNGGEFGAELRVQGGSDDTLVVLNADGWAPTGLRTETGSVYAIWQHAAGAQQLLVDTHLQMQLG